MATEKPNHEWPLATLTEIETAIALDERAAHPTESDIYISGKA